MISGSHNPKVVGSSPAPTTLTGDNKYTQSLSAISKGFRQKKFNHCIFLGTEDIESGELFEIKKWNWTLPEIKYFTKQSYQNLGLRNQRHSFRNFFFKSRIQ